MIESKPILIGGPRCGSEVSPGELTDVLTTEQGSYLKLEALPNWMVNAPQTRPNSPVYVWEHIYHDIAGTASA